MDSIEEALAALADRWSTEEDGVDHVVACQNFSCPTCAVIACATDLRGILRGEQ